MDTLNENSGVLRDGECVVGMWCEVSMKIADKDYSNLRVGVSYKKNYGDLSSGQEELTQKLRDWAGEVWFELNGKYATEAEKLKAENTELKETVAKARDLYIGLKSENDKLKDKLSK